jgi:hypothetical protein
MDVATAAHQKEKLLKFSVHCRSDAVRELMHDTVSCIHKQGIPYFPIFLQCVYAAAPG